MASYDALRYAVVGQYLPIDSPVHRLDPRAKLVGGGLLIAAVVIAAGYTGGFLLLAVTLLLVRLARLPARLLLAGLLPVLPVVGVLALLQVLFYASAFNSDAGHTLWAWGPLHISTAGIRAAVITVLRFVELILLTGLLTSTTTTGALTQGIESLLRPLDKVGLPGHELALVGGIALRFVPILGEQLELIIKAQASRGVSQAAEGRWHLVRNTRRVARLVVPLFVDAYRRSEEMTMAMQARCYQGGRGRTHLTVYRLATADYVALALAVLLVALVLVMQRLP